MNDVFAGTNQYLLMKEQHLQANYQLIQSLPVCTSGEEPEILAANTELLDAGFLQVWEKSEK
jgi:hypothetical protein